MEDRIRQYVESYFTGLRSDPKTLELKEELIGDLLEKYRDLLSEGMRPEAAFGAVVSGAGDIEAMLRELGAKQAPEYYAPGEKCVARKDHTLRNIFLWIFGILALLLILGLGLAFFGLRLAGDVLEAMDLPEVLSSISSFITTDWDADLSDADLYTSEYNIPIEGIDALRIDWSAGSIRLEAAEEGKSEIYIRSVSALDPKITGELEYSLEEGRLHIRSETIGSVKNKSLVLYLPVSLTDLTINSAAGSLSLSGIRADSMDLNTAAGQILMQSCQGKELSIESASGGITLSDCSIDKLKIQCFSGQIDLEGSFEALDIEGLSGGISIISRVCPRMLDAEVVSGNISLTIPENSGFSIRTEGVTMKLDSDFPLTLSERSAVYGDGSANFHVEGVNGNFRIIRAGKEF